MKTKVFLFLSVCLLSQNIQGETTLESYGAYEKLLAHWAKQLELSPNESKEMVLKKVIEDLFDTELTDESQLLFTAVMASVFEENGINEQTDIADERITEELSAQIFSSFADIIEGGRACKQKQNIQEKSLCPLIAAGFD